MLDIGAAENLVGDRWVGRQSRSALLATGGNISYRALDHPQVVGGVGGQPMATQRATIPIEVDEMPSTFTADVVPDSDLPALWGIRSMKDKGAIIDTGNNKLYLPGPSGITIKPHEDTRVIDITPAQTGHLMMRTNKWRGAPVGARRSSSVPSRPSSQRPSINVSPL